MGRKCDYDYPVYVNCKRAAQEPERGRGKGIIHHSEAAGEMNISMLQP